VWTTTGRQHHDAAAAVRSLEHFRELSGRHFDAPSQEISLAMKVKSVDARGP